MIPSAENPWGTKTPMPVEKAIPVLFRRIAKLEQALRKIMEGEPNYREIARKALHVKLERR